MDQKRRRFRICIFFVLTALWIAFIVDRSLQPNHASSEESGFVMDLLHIKPSRIADYLVRKLAHVTEYFILSSLLCIDFRLTVGERTLLPMAIGLTVAVLDEGIQTQVPGRAGRLSDVLIDLAGVCIGVLLLRWFLRIRRKTREKRGR